MLNYREKKQQFVITLDESRRDMLLLRNLSVYILIAVLITQCLPQVRARRRLNTTRETETVDGLSSEKLGVVTKNLRRVFDF